MEKVRREATMKINGKLTGNQSGFTLVEVTIASLILLGGLLTIGVAFSQGLQLISQNPLRLIAKEQMARALDEITVDMENRGIIPVSTSAVPITGTVNLPNGKVLNLGQLGFQKNVTVTDNGGNVLDIQIDVSYLVAGKRQTHTKYTQVSKSFAG